MILKEFLPEIVRDTMLLASVSDHFRSTTHPRGFGRQKYDTWEQQKFLGEGGFGTVWLEQKVEDEVQEGEKHTQLRAVKCIRLFNGSPRSGGKRYVRELETLAKFSRGIYKDSFVEFLGWYEHHDWLLIAMEYCEHGDLRHYLLERKTLPEEEAKEIAVQVLRGIKLMHQNGIANRDIKPANILIKSKPPKEWWVKLCDMGLSKQTEEIAGLNTTVCGTPGFISPELYGLFGDAKEADPLMADMWCLGETMFQALTNRPTFIVAEVFQYHAGTRKFPVEALRAVHASDDAIQFICSLMCVKPSERLTAAKAMDHSWVTTASGSPAPSTAIDPITKGMSDMWLPGMQTARSQPTLASGQWTATVGLTEQPRETVKSSAPVPSAPIKEETLTLHEAVHRNDQHSLIQLLQKGAAPCSMDSHGLEPIFVAVLRSRLACIEILVAHLANIDAFLPAVVARKLDAGIEWLKPLAQMRDDATPLQLAARGMNNLKLSGLLVRLGANVNFVLPRIGEITLNGLCVGHYYKVFKLLVDHGANINHQTAYDGFAPIHWAVKCGNMPLLKLLIQHNAKLDLQANRKRTDEPTALHIAADWGKPDFAIALLEAGARTDIKNANGLTALDMAKAKKGMESIVARMEALRRRGQDQDSPGH